MTTRVIVLGIDVEEWFQTMSQTGISQEDWAAKPMLSEAGLVWLLEELGRHNHRATFFMNGWLANERPDYVRMVLEAGHEVAAHGYVHRSYNAWTPRHAMDDIRNVTAALTAIVPDGMSGLRGFRAPNWSVRRADRWFFDTLQRLGYRYDASIVPRNMYWFGEQCDHGAGMLSEEGLLRVFPACPVIAGICVPLGLAFILRVLPFAVIDRLVRRACGQAGFAQLNIHSWELSEIRPPRSGGLASDILLSAGTGKRIRRTLAGLFQRYKIVSFSDYLAETDME